MVSQREIEDTAFDWIKKESKQVKHDSVVNKAAVVCNTTVESSSYVNTTTNYETDTTDICDKQVSSEHNILTSPCTSYSVETTPQIIQQTNHHDNVVTCKFCFNTFTSTSSLSDHINSLHQSVELIYNSIGVVVVCDNYTWYHINMTTRQYITRVIRVIRVCVSEGGGLR